MRSIIATMILIGTGAITFADAQTPVPGGRSESRVFSFAFDGDRSYLGVQTEDISKENFSKYGLRDVRGVAVAKVMDGSPAQAAGLQAGDVIIRFNGEDVTGVRKLMRLITEVAVDQQARIVILRNGDERQVTATLAKRPLPKFEDGGFSVVPGRPSRIMVPGILDMPEGNLRAIPPPPGDSESFVFLRGLGGRQIGINASPLTKQLADYFKVSGGVLINNVRENSPAAKAGLKAGDIVVEADGKEIKSNLDLIRTISEKREGDVQLSVVRDGSRQTVRVTPEENKGLFKAFEAPADSAPDDSKPAAPTVPIMPTMPLVPTPVI